LGIARQNRKYVLRDPLLPLELIGRAGEQLLARRHGLRWPSLPLGNQAADVRGPRLTRLAHGLLRRAARRLALRLRTDGARGGIVVQRRGRLRRQWRAHTPLRRRLLGRTRKQRAGDRVIKLLVAACVGATPRHHRVDRQVNVASL